MLPQIHRVLQPLIHHIDPDHPPRQRPQHPVPRRRPPRRRCPAPDAEEAPQAQEDAHVGDEDGEGVQVAAGAEEEVDGGGGGEGEGPGGW